MGCRRLKWTPTFKELVSYLSLHVPTLTICKTTTMDPRTKCALPMGLFAYKRRKGVTREIGTALSVGSYSKINESFSSSRHEEVNKDKNETNHGNK